MNKLKNLDLLKRESFSLNCIKEINFQYNVFSGTGWNRTPEIKKGSFKKGFIYQFTKSDPKISGNQFHCKEMDINFKKEYIESLLDSGNLT